MITHVRDLPLMDEEPRFFQISGRVLSMSLPEQYTLVRVFCLSYF